MLAPSPRAVRRRSGADVVSVDGSVASGTVGGRQANPFGRLRPRGPIRTLPMQVTFRRLDKELPPLSRAHPGDGGVDLYAREEAVLGPDERVIVPTGIAVGIPEGYAGLVVPRSGLAARFGVGVVNAPGLVDSGYRGEIKVILVNHGSEKVRIERGDRIAQLVVVPIGPADFVEVDELSDTSRGDGGLGSTGR